MIQEVLNNSPGEGSLASEVCAQEPRRGGHGVLVRVHRLLPALPGLQLLRWGADPSAEPLIFSLWCEPTQDLWLVGRGAAVSAEAPAGEQRFLALSDLRSRLFEQVHVAGPPIPSEVPAAWLTSRFHSTPGLSGAAVAAWQGWPSAQLRVPAEVAYRSGGRTGWVGQAWVEDPSEARAVLDRLNQRAATLGALQGPLPPDEAPVALEREALPERERWLDLVERARETLAEGELRKLVLARALRLRRQDGRSFSPTRALERLVERHADQPGAIVFAEGAGGACFLGASPEPLFRLSERRLTTQALAGTAPAHQDPEQALLADPKTRREHGLVVDAIRGALASR
ncbi:MAG TPA: hypothetical protein DEA08_05525, partial [Planctomycetes bacterium]|nr:hypothetical protein [Planctomycetota bacterium]